MNQKSLKKTDKLKFLIIDDDVVFSELWKSIINSLNRNIEIDWAENPQTAIELLSKQSLEKDFKYDLIICDMYLSDTMTGADIIKNHIVADRPPILLTTAMGKDTYLQNHADLSKRVHFIQKPFHIPRTVELIKDMLNGKPLREEQHTCNV